MPSWFSQTKPIPSLEAEICFTIQDTFYYGPDRTTNADDLEKLVVELRPPNIQRIVPSLLRTSEVLGQEQALVNYYQQIIRFARQYKRPFNSIRHQFWLRLWLWNTEQNIHVSFPWYDSFSEIDGFLSKLVELENGLVVHDMDQGWEMEIHSDNGQLYIRQRDPDDDETHACISLPRDSLVAKLIELRSRARDIIAHLSHSLGADVWTSYVYNEPSFRIPKL